MNQRLLIFATVMMTALSASAFELDGLNYNRIDGKTVEVTCESVTTSSGMNGETVYNYSSNYSGDIVIPDSITYKNRTYAVTRIGNYAFVYCSKMTSVKLPNTLTEIGAMAFCGCSGLTEIELPSSLTTIGDHAFCLCENFTSVVVPESVTTIDRYAFDSCTNLLEIKLPNSLTTLGESAMRLCKSLTSIIIPDGVKKLDRTVFSTCESLRFVTLGREIEVFGGYSFHLCTNVEELTVLNPVPPTLKKASYADIYLGLCDIPLSKCTLKVPEEAVEKYKAADGWSQFSTIVGIVDGIDGIKNQPTSSAAYTLDGRRADSNYKGIVIQDGKKLIVR